MARKQTVRDIIRFTDSDIGKRVVFSHHENSVIYEQFLEGKSGIIKKVTNRSFDQQIAVDFDYILQFSPHPFIRSSICKTSERDLVVKSIEHGKITFCQGQPYWNSEKNPAVHGMSLCEVGGKQFDLVEEKKFVGGIYFGFGVPTTELKFVHHYHNYPPIGPVFGVSADDLVLQ